MSEVNELIEQMGGRERLEAFSAGHYCSIFECRNMARALLSVLDAKPAGVTVSPTLAAMDEVSQVGIDVYTTPPAASAPEGLAAAVNRLLDSDGSRGTFSAIRRGDALAEVGRLLASAPAPGGDGG